MKKLTLLYSALFAATAFAAVADEPTLQDRLPRHLHSEDNSFFTLTVENDLFGGGTDENYTNGVRLSYYNDTKEAPQFAQTIGEVVPFFDVNDNTNIYYSVGQNLYTPRDITARVPDPADRPYAAFLYGSIGYTTLSENHIDEIEVTLGVIGPAALGGPTQDFVHDFIDADDPSGWGSQLKNEPGVMLAYQRSWPEAYFSEFDPFYFRIAPHAAATVGNIYTYGAAGVTFQLVPTRYKWQAPPPRVRPSIPGSGYFAVPEDKFAWSLFAGFEGRAIARNIFLDGNSFRRGPSVDKRHGVLDASAGVSFTYGKAQLAYTLNYRSKEFANQDDSSLFGSVSLGYRF